MLYVGVDLHRKRSHVTALNEQGGIVLNRRIENSPERFVRIFGELAPEPLAVAFEATYGWSWFADLLSDAGIEAHMAHPLATKAIAAGRVKNDAVDARTLAHLLRTHLLPEGWIAPPAIRERRSTGAHSGILPAHRLAPALPDPRPARRPRSASADAAALRPGWASVPREPRAPSGRARPHRRGAPAHRRRSRRGDEPRSRATRCLRR